MADVTVAAGTASAVGEVAPEIDEAAERARRAELRRARDLENIERLTAKVASLRTTLASTEAALAQAIAAT